MPSSFLQQIREGGQGTPLPTCSPGSAPPLESTSQCTGLRRRRHSRPEPKLKTTSAAADLHKGPSQGAAPPGARASIQVPALLYSPGSDSPGRIAQPGSKWHLG